MRINNFKTEFRMKLAEVIESEAGGVRGLDPMEQVLNAKDCLAMVRKMNFHSPT